jgi:hypothetical protein
LPPLPAALALPWYIFKANDCAGGWALTLAGYCRKTSIAVLGW